MAINNNSDNNFVKFQDNEKFERDETRSVDNQEIKQKFKFNIDIIFLPINRALLGLLSLICLYLAFYFSGLCEVKINNGIISSVFSSCLIFVSIFFYLFFGQKLSYKVIIGNAFILISVCLISIS